MAGLLKSFFSWPTFTQKQSEELQIAESIYLRGEQGLLEVIHMDVDEVKKQREILWDDKGSEPDNMHPQLLQKVAEQRRPGTGGLKNNKCNTVMK